MDIYDMNESLLTGSTKSLKETSILKINKEMFWNLIHFARDEFSSRYDSE